MPKKPIKNGVPSPPATDANEGERSVHQRRGAEDRVHRLRSQLWFCVLQAHRATPQDPAEMDRYFLGSEVDLGGRVFRRIRDNASDPGLKRKALGGDSVVGRVAARSGSRDTQEVYDSALWPVLEPTPLTPDEREVLIASLLRKFALYESGPDDAVIFRHLGMVDFRGMRRTRSEFRRAIAQLARTRSIDRILLLCLFYRRYLECGRWGEARDVRDAVLRAIRRFCDRPGFTGDVKTLWVFMTRRRIFAGQPSLEHTWQALFDARELLAGWEVMCKTEAEHVWFLEQVWLYACARENAEEAPAPHLVPRDPAVETFLSSRDRLMAEALEAAAAAWSHLILMPRCRQPRALGRCAATAGKGGSMPLLRR
jgi:hypothetical protein